jgi:hypothetical protein
MHLAGVAFFTIPLLAGATLGALGGTRRTVLAGVGFALAFLVHGVAAASTLADLGGPDLLGAIGDGAAGLRVLAPLWIAGAVAGGLLRRGARGATAIAREPEPEAA